MLCYRDRTFCDYYDCKISDSCDIKITDEIIEKSQNFGLPLCIFAERPECFVAKINSVGQE